MNKALLFKIIRIVICGGCVLVGALIFAMAFMSGMMIFDAPGSGKNPITWMLFLSALGFGPALAMGGIGALDSYKFLFIPIIVGLILYGSIVALDMFCEGKFSC